MCKYLLTMSIMFFNELPPILLLLLTFYHAIHSPIVLEFPNLYLHYSA